jgi:hypothetical protein
MSWQAWDFGASGLTLIDGANIITGTILANSIKSKSIGANQIAAGAIDTSLLTFTPVTSGTGGATDLAKQVVAAINSDQEGGLKIVANKLTLTGLLQVGGAAADINSGVTLISGGKIQTDSIDAAAIKAGAITTDKLTVGTVQRQNLIVNGHFGTYNTFGNSATGWTLDSAVSFVSQYGTYTSAGSTVALKVPSLQANPGSGGKVLAQQVVTVIPGRQYTLVGMLYHDAGTAGIRVFTAKGSGDYELSSNTSAGTPAGSIVPAFYQNATYISNGASASSTAARWNLYGYRVSIPTDVTQVAIQICGWNTATTNYYPGFIQFYDDNLTEATASLDMVNQLQNVAFGGDVAGNYAAVTVNRIRNRNVSAAAPDNGSVLTWNNTSSWWEPNTITGILGYTPANKAGDNFNGAMSFTLPVVCHSMTMGANFTGNWSGANYWGIGPISSHGIRLGMVDSSNAFMTPPGDMSLQIDGSVSMNALSATTGTFSGTLSLPSNGSAYFKVGNGDAASMATCNIDLAVWNGLGLWNPTTSGTFPNQRSIYFDVRNGAAGFGGGISATTGTFSGVLSASQFNGSGAGLTGTATSLTAGAVINATISNSFSCLVRGVTDCNSYNTSGFYGFNNVPANGPGIALGSLIVANNTDTCLQIAGGYNTDNLYFRGATTYNTGWTPWRTVIHSGNIGNTGLPIGGTTGTFSGALSATSGSFTLPVVCHSMSVGANFTGNWSGANYWGIGPISAHGIRLGMVDSSNAFMTPPGDMSLQIDASVSMGALTATTGTFSGNVYLANTNTGINGSGFSLNAGNGYALRFWNGADAYSIGMNDYTSTSFGNNGYNTGGADYNMCFRMDGNDSKRGGSDSVARGFLFRNNSVGSNTFAQLAPFGNYSYWGGILMLRDSGNNNMYGLFVLNGVLYLKQMA